MYTFFHCALYLSHQILKDKKDAKIRELEARVSDLELEKVKLVNAGSERLRAVKDIRHERDQLLNEVKTSRTELNNLSGTAPQFLCPKCWEDPHGCPHPTNAEMS